MISMIAQNHEWLHSDQWHLFAVLFVWIQPDAPPQWERCFFLCCKFHQGMLVGWQQWQIFIATELWCIFVSSQLCVLQLFARRMPHQMNHQPAECWQWCQSILAQSQSAMPKNLWRNLVSSLASTHNDVKSNKKCEASTKVANQPAERLSSKTVCLCVLCGWVGFWVARQKPVVNILFWKNCLIFLKTFCFSWCFHFPFQCFLEASRMENLIDLVGSFLFVWRRTNGVTCPSFAQWKKLESSVGFSMLSAWWLVSSWSLAGMHWKATMHHLRSNQTLVWTKPKNFQFLAPSLWCGWSKNKEIDWAHCSRFWPSVFASLFSIFLGFYPWFFTAPTCLI